MSSSYMHRTRQYYSYRRRKWIAEQKALEAQEHARKLEDKVEVDHEHNEQHGEHQEQGQPGP